MILCELSDTVDLMIEGGYKERFLAEYAQLSIRLLKLQNTITTFKNGVLDFDPETPIEILEAQEETMSLYKSILEKRATFEKINLPEVTL